MFHVEVSLGTPFGSGNMPKAGTDQHEGGFAIRKGSNDFGSTFDLSVDPFQSIVGPDPGPMLSWKTHIGESFVYTGLNLISSLAKLHFAITVFIHTDCYKDRDIFKLSASASFEEDTIYIDVGVRTA